MLSLTNQNKNFNETKEHLVYKHPLNYLITALPYVDEENINDQKNSELALQLIENELKIINKKDYLEDLPLPELKFINSENFEKEIQRIKNQDQELLKKLNRYDLDTTDLEKSRENLKILEEYNSLK